MVQKFSSRFDWNGKRGIRLRISIVSRNFLVCHLNFQFLVTNRKCSIFNPALVHKCTLEIRGHYLSMHNPL